MDLIKANWDWIASNPWGFAALSILMFGIGWGFAKQLYSERIELLKAQIASPSKSSPENSPVIDFRYRSHGRHGRNILAETTHDVMIDEKLSFHASVPDGKKLHVVLHGRLPQSLSETSGHGISQSSASTIGPTASIKRIPPAVFSTSTQKKEPLICSFTFPGLAK